ncbi:hypothetical protein [Hamadaea tsunoensis]|nr:hypothetical protein [Hamadaea tsunoensis]
MSAPDNPADPGIRGPRRRRGVRVAVLCVVVAAIVFLAALSWTRG